MVSSVKTMVLKIADEYRPPVVSNTEGNSNLVVVREYCEERDKVSVEKMETQCDVGQKGKPSIFTDLLGDPICRIRQFPLHVMLVNTIYIYMQSTSENDAFISVFEVVFFKHKLKFRLGYFIFSLGVFLGIA